MNIGGHRSGGAGGRRGGVDVELLSDHYKVEKEIAVPGFIYKEEVLFIVELWREESHMPFTKYKIWENSAAPEDDRRKFDIEDFLSNIGF